MLLSFSLACLFDIDFYEVQYQLRLAVFNVLSRRCVHPRSKYTSINKPVFQVNYRIITASKIKIYSCALPSVYSLLFVPLSIIVTTAHIMWAVLTEFFFPKRCVGCHKMGAYLCLDCRNLIRPVDVQLCAMCDRPAVDGMTHPICKTRYSVDGLTTAYKFRPIIKDLVHELKYRGVSDVISLCARLLARKTPQAILERKPVITAVPLHKHRYNERGFNQSALMAHAVAKELRLPLNTQLLLRVRDTKTQTKLHREERQENMKGAFQVIGDVRGKSIVLIDDTVTTGATVRECANMLKRSGAQWVWVLALAQA